jgi:predicted RNA binding protein YcfA (HicA-like mRNA interferase family)
VKLPRDASGEAVVAALERLGFERVRQIGSHIRLTKGPLHVTVPRHDSLAPGTLRSILRQAGIEVETLLEVL